MEVVASLSQGRTAAAQCGLFTYKSVPVIFEPPCTIRKKNFAMFCLIILRCIMNVPDSNLCSENSYIYRGFCASLISFKEFLRLDIKIRPRSSIQIVKNIQDF